MLQVTPKGQDLRSWIDQMEAAGEILRIDGAEREEEIGGIVEILLLPHRPLAVSTPPR